MNKKNLEPGVILGDKILDSFSVFGPFIYDFPIPKGKEVQLFDLKFSSPLIGASFKSQTNIMAMWMRMGLGGAIYKTIMSKKRDGNPSPRLQDAIYKGQKGILNSLGLPGQGVDEFANGITTSKLWSFDRPLGISIGGESHNEYIENLIKIDKAFKNIDKQYFYELNISCPNTENGVTICQEPENLESLLASVRKITDAAISIKVSPDVPDKNLLEIGEIASFFEKIIINAGNTKVVKPEDANVDPNNFSMPAGGLSGLPVLKRTIAMVKLFSNFKNPIMATGGISNISHVNAAKSAGASLYGMATSLVLDPYCIPRINSQL